MKNKLRLAGVIVLCAGVLMLITGIVLAFTVGTIAVPTLVSSSILVNSIGIMLLRASGSRRDADSQR